jgi:RNA ligase (TIGR02306 family)
VRKLASVQRIIDIKPIPGADAIEVATVLGWHVVVKKGEFRVGDLCVYFEVDSLLPIRTDFDFLAARGTKKTLVDGKSFEGYRLKTVKLRGQVSQGLCLPVSIIDDGLDVWEEGTDVSTMLSVYKYEPPMPGELQGIAKGNLPGDIPKTDETRIQSFPEVLKRCDGETFFVTEKLDGSSTTVFVEDGELNVCGRTVNWKRESDNSYWRAAIASGLDDKKQEIGKIVLQGELVGEAIQGNKLKIKGQKIFFYNAYDRSEARYLNYKEFIALCAKLAIPIVPIVTSDFSLVGHSVDSLVDYATRKSQMNGDVWAEGIVIRPLIEKKDPNLGRLSFKVINPNFLLKYDE